MEKEKAQKAETERLKELLQRANGILKELDESYIFQAGHHEEHEFPKFQQKEIKLAKQLGRGGFCDVFEVGAIDLQPNDENKNKVVNKEVMDINDPPIVDAASQMHGEDETHYEVTTAREYMATHCIREGDARYAIKILRRDISEFEQHRAMIDLAIEIKLFTVLWHPNIGTFGLRQIAIGILIMELNILCVLCFVFFFWGYPFTKTVKMRAIGDMPRLSLSSYIIMDRLFGTLDKKIASWREIRNANKGCFGIGANKFVLQELLKDRLLVAYDLAAAFDYLHTHRYVLNFFSSRLLQPTTASDPKKKLTVGAMNFFPHHTFLHADWFIGTSSQKILVLTFEGM